MRISDFDWFTLNQDRRTASGNHMIRLENIRKRYRTQHMQREVLRDVSVTIKKGEKLGILGRNGAGKSTLIRIISGIENPTAGHVTRNMSISWPLAFSGGFQGSLTGLDNLRFTCRVYGIDYKSVIDYVQDFAELGKYFREPVKYYSSGMRARLAFALSMAIEFDCFLIDEVVAVGDQRFREKCHRELFENRKGRSIILVSHELHAVREYCDHVSILDQGILKSFDSIDEGLAFYESL